MKNFFKKALSTLALFGSAFGAKTTAKDVSTTELENAIQQTASETQNKETELNNDEKDEGTKKENLLENEKEETNEKERILTKFQNKKKKEKTKELDNQKNKKKKKDYILRGKVIQEKPKEDTPQSDRNNEEFEINKENIDQEKEKMGNIERKEEKKSKSDNKEKDKINEKESKEIEKEMLKVKDKILNNLFLKAKTTMLSGRKLKHLNGMETLEIKLVYPAPDKNKKPIEQFYELNLAAPKPIIYNEICKLIFHTQMIPISDRNLELSEKSDDQLKMNLCMHYMEDHEIYNYIEKRLDKLPDSPRDESEKLNEKYLKALETIRKLREENSRQIAHESEREQIEITDKKGNVMKRFIEKIRTFFKLNK